MSNKQDLFDEENEIKLLFAEWDKIGKSYRGILVKKEVVPNRLKPGTNQTIYTLTNAKVKKDNKSEWEDVEGGILKVAGRGSGNPQQIPGFEIVKFGVEVGVKFIEERDAPKPGFNKIKVIRAFRDPKNVIHQEVLDEFQGFNIENEAQDLAQETVDQM